MICVICDSEIFEAESCEQYNIDGKTVMIGKITVLKCPRCGEVYYGNEVLDRIDTIISEIRHQEAFRKMPQTLVCC
jgi:YgiT-type zinc finger domain-containing protein